MNKESLIDMETKESSFELDIDATCLQPRDWPFMMKSPKRRNDDMELSKYKISKARMLGLNPDA